jgi:hypothetical protein
MRVGFVLLLLAACSSRSPPRIDVEERTHTGEPRPAPTTPPAPETPSPPDPPLPDPPITDDPSESPTPAGGTGGSASELDLSDAVDAPDADAGAPRSR